MSFFLSCPQSIDATGSVNWPFWAAPRVRRKFGAQRRIAQGRLCRPRAFKSPKGGGSLWLPKPKKKDTLFSVSFFLEVPPRFELGVELLQSSALPLGYGTKNMERVTGLEPATSTLARWRSTR